MEVAARRLVLKVGTSTLTAGAYALSADRLDALVAAIACCKRDGRDVVLVTSGAIVTGASRLGLKAPPRAMPDRQALAAVGQAILMHEYDRRFAGHGILVGQVLLTAGDFDHRRRYLNARNTLEALLRRGAVPIVNENDTVATEEIRIGENDTLSARVAALIDADLLCILSDVDGLYTGDPRKDPNATRITVVDRITRKLETFAAETGSLTGVGGMATKVRAARMATASGVEVVIAHGGDPDVVARVLAGEDAGTRFRAQATPLRGRRRWLALRTRVRGQLRIDAGAAAAVRDRGKSLLPSGITAVDGDFEAGDVVSILGPDGDEIGRGVSTYNREDLDRIKGRRSPEAAAILGVHVIEAVHRDNMVVEP